MTPTKTKNYHWYDTIVKKIPTTKGPTTTTTKHHDKKGPSIRGSTLELTIMRSSQTTHLALPLHHPRVCSSASSTPVHNVSCFLHLLLTVCAKQGMFKKFHVDQRCVDSFSQLTLEQRLGDWIFLGKHESSWYMQCEFQFLDRSWNIMKEEEEGWSSWMAHWPNIQNRGKHGTLQRIPLTDVAPGKTLLSDISPTNEPKYSSKYLKTMSGWLKIHHQQKSCSKDIFVGNWLPYLSSFATDYVSAPLWLKLTQNSETRYIWAVLLETVRERVVVVKEFLARHRVSTLVC